MKILILQKNTGKAGAQNSLRRLLLTKAFQEQNILIVTGTEGWFLEQIKSLDIPHVSVDFPACRSLYGKILGNRIWVKRVHQSLKKLGFVPDILQANNHMEAPFLRLLKKRYSNAKTAVFFRDGYISESSYIKYQCQACDIRVAVSQSMRDALKWDRQVMVFNNGVFENEIYPTQMSKSAFPNRWLVIGNPSEGKGWFDFLSALTRLKEQNCLEGIKKIVFTGLPSGNIFEKYQNICQKFNGTISLEFVPFFENLGQACQEFDVIVHPSRKESFGMAMLEACCSGKCVISSKTGIADKVILNPKLLFMPGHIDGLADCLNYVLFNWRNIDNSRDESLRVIRQSFSVEDNAQKLVDLYREACTTI